MIKKKMVGGCEMCNSKDLKSSHQTGQTFHKSCNNDIKFPLMLVFFYIRTSCSSETAPTIFLFKLRPLDDVINCNVIT